MLWRKMSPTPPSTPCPRPSTGPSSPWPALDTEMWLPRPLEENSSDHCAPSVEFFASLSPFLSLSQTLTGRRILTRCGGLYFYIVDTTRSLSSSKPSTTRGQWWGRGGRRRRRVSEMIATDSASATTLQTWTETTEPRYDHWTSHAEHSYHIIETEEWPGSKRHQLFNWYSNLRQRQRWSLPWSDQPLRSIIKHFSWISIVYQ